MWLCGCCRHCVACLGRYFDLRQNRTSDYKFSYKKMLARNGDTAVYMQYAHARIASMARKAGVDPTTLDPSLVDLEHQSAVDLAYHISMFQVRCLTYRPSLTPGGPSTTDGCLDVDLVVCVLRHCRRWYPASRTT